MSTLASVEPAAATLAAQVTPEEYARLLMLPRKKLLEDDLAERARAARAWYAGRGRPWIGARRVDIARLDAAGVTLTTGQAFLSAALADRLRGADAHAVVAVAVTAGAEAEAEYRRQRVDLLVNAADAAEGNSGSRLSLMSIVPKRRSKLINLTVFRIRLFKSSCSGSDDCGVENSEIWRVIFITRLACSSIISACRI